MSLGEKVYNWKRFWCPRDETINLDRGFLPDPDSKWGDLYNSKVKPIEHFAAYQCLVFLGEPGIGKSFEVDKNKLVIGAASMQLAVDLSSFGDIKRLEDNIFRGSEIENWKKNENEQLMLVFDSFDECRLHTDQLTSYLIQELRSLPIDRLLLRIVCRTGYWPLGFEKELKRIFGGENAGQSGKDKNFCIAELMPLRRDDISQAASDENIVAEEFLKSILAKDITAFAARPVTLSMLINLYTRDGDLPANQIEIYKKGCMRLCDEPNNMRRDSRVLDQMTSQQKMHIAGRVAVAMRFSNKSVISTELEEELLPENILPVSAIYGKDSFIGNIDRQSVIDTLATGLFSAREQGVGWAHQTYGDFLAALYLFQQSASSQQVMNLIANPDGKIIPKLDYVASWIAMLDSKMFDVVLNSDPQMLLLGDLSSVSATTKAAVIDNFFSKITAENAVDREMKDRFRYDRLKYDGMEEQLRPYLSRSTNETVRHEAMEIVMECHLEQLGKMLCNIALDKKDSKYIREMAVFVLSRIGTPNDRKRLKPLVKNDPEDSIDQIKGYALKAVWPDQISAKNLFQVLTPPKRKNFIGGYAWFLSEELVKGLRAKDLPIALKWIIDQPIMIPRSLSRYDELTEAILRLAWENLFAPGVLELFAKITILRIKAHRAIVENRYDDRFVFGPEDDNKRRVLIEQIISCTDMKREEDTMLVISDPPLVHIDDADWLLEKYKSAHQELKMIWANLLRMSWNYAGTPSNVTTKIYDLYKTDTDFAMIFGEAFEAVGIDSDTAKRERQNYEMFLKHQNTTRRIKKDFSKEAAKHIKAGIALLEQGDSEEWWRLIYNMSTNEDGEHPSGIPLDIKTLPGWIHVDEQNKVAVWAEMFLVNRSPKVEQKHELLYFNSAGVQAICYLYKLGKEIPAVIWGKWACPIVHFPMWADRENLPLIQELASAAYAADPRTVVKLLKNAIDYELQHDENYEFLSRYDLCWNERLIGVLFKKLKKTETSKKTFAALLDKLTDLKFGQAIEYANNVISGEDREKAVVAANILLVKFTEKYWGTIWLVMNNDLEFGKKLMLENTGFIRGGQEFFARRLQEKPLAELYR